MCDIEQAGKRSRVYITLGVWFRGITLHSHWRGPGFDSRRVHIRFLFAFCFPSIILFPLGNYVFFICSYNAC
ncbi:hypothetical protein BDW67DRAFT_156447 [Aspergillus spinulosporus]